MHVTLRFHLTKSIAVEIVKKQYEYPCLAKNGILINCPKFF